MLNKWLCLLIVFCLLAITPALVLAQNPDATVTPTLQQQGNESEQEEVTPTPTSTPTNTPVPPTATPTLTPLPATGTPTPTPTVTPIWPTDTPTRLPTTAATATPTNGPSCMDVREPNDQPGSGPTLTINQTVANLTLHPYGDIDYFMLWGKTGKYYDITTASSQGVDTRVKVFDPAGYLVAENDDFQTGNPASRASFQAPMEGWYYVSVDSRVPTAWECRQYTITAVDVSAPTATPTRAVTPGPPPTATPPPTAIPAEQMYDDYEPNYDFNTAANVGVGQTINLNFNPWPAGSQDIDNDYFKLYVKVGERLRIETIELAQGVDTNMILFRDNGQIVHGNDDCLEGQRASCIDWSPDYTGVAYIVIGPVGTIPEGIAAGSRAYSLMIKDTAGQPATPIADGSINATPFASGTPQLGLPWAVTPLASTPVSIGATPLSLMVPFGTPTPMVQVRPIQPVGLPTPTLPPLQLITIDVKIFYDENNNRAPDASEGVSGISIRILDSTNNNLLGQTFTGSQGYAALTVTAVNEVRLSIPYLGYNEKISAPGQEVSIRLNPLRLPSLIP